MSKAKNIADLNKPLSEAEFVELDRFLASDCTSDETMMIDTLDGYLTAIALGPVDIPISQWLPRVWGTAPAHAPKFKNEAQAERVLNLILRQMNGIIYSLEDDLENFQPVMDMVQENDAEFEDGEMWAYGFMSGVNLVRAEWQPLFDQPEAMAVLMPVYLLGSDELQPELASKVETVAQRGELAAQLPATVASLYQFWLPYREAQLTQALQKTKATPKVGRNDVCPCGSGRKFKKCCGAEA